MHELPVTQSILDIALRHAHTANANRIININVTIGQLSSIIDDSILFYWDIISKDTIAEGARIKFKRIPTQMVCLNCGNSYTPGDLEFDCPNCGSSKIKIQSGREFFLESIDVE